MKYQNYVQMLTKCCISVFEEMAKTKVNSHEIKSNDQQSLSIDYPVAIIISYKDENEKLKGNFLLGFSDKEMATILAASIVKNTGLQPIEEFNEMASDILFEFMNTVVGQTTTEWEQLGLSAEFSTPYTSKEDTIDLKCDYYNESYIIKLNIENNSVIINVSFNETSLNPLMGRRILIVDDSQMIRLMLKQEFEKEGCKISEAKNGLAGVQQFISFHPDLTVMDLIMPELGGLEAIARIRKIDSTTKIVMLTSSSKKSEVIAAAQLQVQGYIKKPVKASKLIDLAKSFFTN